MKEAKGFRITRFVNPSGVRVFRVIGTLNGKTVRKNFKSRAEAVAFRQQMDVELLNQESEGQMVWTTLTQDQSRGCQKAAD